MIAIKRMVRKIPKPIPALNIPPIAAHPEQMVRNKKKKEKRIAFFIEGNFILN